ncbi:MAG TPA: hypothetical protein PLP29_07875 [Candidatus Ozemobacteraceae bacterium]|nr:hypothetical protein [Candidatus Ozemobacteraceae bacterium]
MLPILLVVFLARVVFPFVFASDGPRHRRLEGVLGLGSVLAGLFAWQFMHLDHDEVEHLNCAWQVSQGLLPFRDFWQHHLPTLWFLLAPVTRLFDAGSSLLETARLASLTIALVSGVLAWKLSSRLHGGQAPSRAVFLFFWAAMLIPFQWNYIRPDLVAAPFVLTGLILLLSASPDSLGIRFSAGLFLGIALSLTPKVGFLLGCAALADAFCRPFPGIASAFRRLVALSAGVAAGLLPLALWLVRYDLVEACLYGTFTFNRKFQSYQPPGGYIPVSLIFSTIVIWWRWPGTDPDERRRRGILAAASIGSVVPMLLSPHKFLYHLQLSTLLLATALAPSGEEAARELVRKGKFVFLAVTCVVLLLPSQYYIRYAAWAPFYEKLVQIDILQSLAERGPVSLIYPDHPILCKNATGFDHAWFWNFLEFPVLHGDLQKPLGSFTEQLISRRPLIISSQNRIANFPFSRYPEQERTVLSSHLLKTGFIDRATRDRLQGFLEKEYRLVNIVGVWFWLRNDIPKSF